MHYSNSSIIYRVQAENSDASTDGIYIWNEMDGFIDVCKVMTRMTYSYVGDCNADYKGHHDCNLSVVISCDSKSTPTRYPPYF